MLLTFVAQLTKPKRKRDDAPTLRERMGCWACGLYETEPGICSNCPKINDWTRENFEKVHWRDRMLANAPDSDPAADAVDEPDRGDETGRELPPAVKNQVRDTA